MKYHQLDLTFLYLHPKDAWVEIITKVSVSFCWSDPDPLSDCSDLDYNGYVGIEMIRTKVLVDDIPNNLLEDFYNNPNTIKNYNKQLNSFIHQSITKWIKYESNL